MATKSRPNSKPKPKPQTVKSQPEAGDTSLPSSSKIEDGNSEVTTSDAEAIMFAGCGAAAPVIVETTAGQRPESRAAQEFQTRDTIHASECVVNSECTLTPECRGRLKQTNAISGKVQIFCGKCGKFAAGTRPAHGLVSTSGGKLYDRFGGK